MKRLLQINIPTRNRAALLGDLLTSMLPVPDWAQVAVFDNASEDDTTAVATRHGVAHYERHAFNTGPAFNQLLAASFDNGAKYVWVLGDDELLAPNWFAHILEALQDPSDPVWVLLGCEGEYANGLASRYCDAKLWARHARTVRPEVLLHATCWSGNVFKPSVFKHSAADAITGSIFPHFHALMQGVAESGKAVLVCQKPTVLYRPVRPLPPDNEHPQNTDYHLACCAKRLRDLFGLSIEDNFFSRILSRRLIKEPLRHWRYFLSPKNWPKILNRIRYLR